jgi:integrase
MTLLPYNSPSSPAVIPADVSGTASGDSPFSYYDDITMTSKGERIATINCNACGAVMRQEKCACGHTVCHLRTKKDEPKIYRDFRTKAPLTFITAKQVLRHMITAHEQDTYNPLDYNPASLEQFQLKHQIVKYLEAVKKKAYLGELSLGTLSVYKYQLAHVTRLIGGIDVREVDYQVLENDLSDKLEMNICSKRCVLRALRGFYTWQKRRPRNERIIREIPTWFYPKGNDSKVRKVPSVELTRQALMRIPEEHRDIFEYAMLTGLRPGEICTLKISDHNLDRKEITVQRSLSGGNRIRERDKEEHKSNISMAARCVEIFKKHSYKRFADDFLFINPVTGKRYQKLYLSRDLWNKYSETGLDSYSCTRHFFCTNITRILKGDIVKTAKMMRHKSLKTTERYIHQETQELEPTSNAMADLLDLTAARERKEGER